VHGELCARLGRDHAGIEEFVLVVSSSTWSATPLQELGAIVLDLTGFWPPGQLLGVGGEAGVAGYDERVDGALPVA
jgi:hypothetical protein